MELKQRNKVLYIKIAGDLDHHSAVKLRDKIDSEFERTSSRHIIFDFSQIEFMDSSGIGMVIGRHKNAEKVGGTVSIAGMCAEITRIYQISGLAKIIRSFPSILEAEQAI
jgi:stage II sporulation protein AA (anti-sigma F factor antagonist)